MNFELVHTSVERGLRGGSGFETAVLTRGMPAGLDVALASLSGYDADATRAIGADRIEWAHRLVLVQNRSFTVLSRIGPCGNDASGRPNRIAHHLVLDPLQRTEAGPAWMLANFQRFETTVPTVEERANGPTLPAGSVSPRRAEAWKRAGFDPGYAGLVAQTLVDAPSSPCCVLLPELTDTLPLIEDVLALMPPDRRWLVTFSTRPDRMQATVRCQLRLVRAGAAGVKSLLLDPGTRRIDVAPGGSAGEGAGAEAGREGRFVESSVRSTRVHPVMGAGVAATQPTVPQAVVPPSGVRSARDAVESRTPEAQASGGGMDDDARLPSAQVFGPDDARDGERDGTPGRRDGRASDPAHDRVRDGGPRQHGLSQPMPPESPPRGPALPEPVPLPPSGLDLSTLPAIDMALFIYSAIAFLAGCMMFARAIF